METNVTYVSFLLRVWRSPETDPLSGELQWQYEVESIQSGQMWQPRDLESLMALLQTYLSGGIDQRPA